MKAFILILMVLTFCHLGAQEAIIIDHTCTDLSKIPRSPIDWIEEAKKLTLHYAHTSHGGQVTSGIINLESLYPIYSVAIRVSGNAGLPPIEPDPVLRVYDGNPPETYITPSDYWDGQTGQDRTRAVASTGDYDFSMWSWCGQVSGASEAYIQSYLVTLNQFESEYSGMRFIYMTGHLDGSRSGGNLHLRNEQIRNYCRTHHKVLFDFADIERYDPDGTDYLDLGANDNCDYDYGNWADQWCAANSGSNLCDSCSCAHSKALNCNMKARAFWWMMARLAGWDGCVANIYITNPNGGESLNLGSTYDITWDASGLSNNIKVTLWQNGSLMGTIATKLNPDSGSYTWLVGQYIGGTATVGLGYTIKIKEIGTSVSDTTDAPFSLALLTVTAPNGGENWRRGSTENITWNFNGVSNNLKILLYKDGNPVGLIANNVNFSSGYHPWIVGNYMGGVVQAGTGGYSIAVKEQGTSLYDYSDTAFQITSRWGIISPNGGEVWNINSTGYITWDAPPTTGNLKILLCKDGAKVGVIAHNVEASSGSYLWKIGMHSGGIAPAGSGYQVVIKERGTPTHDISDGSFTLIN
jgi:hypothetical protein